MRVLPISLGFALLLAAPGVYAQTAPAKEGAKELSDKDKADESDTAIKAMREVLARVSRLSEEARGERDALRLNCINERKSQIAGLVKVAELALEELVAAAKERQFEAVDHEFNKISIAHTKVAGYKTEADQCIGMLAFYDGEDVEIQFIDDNKDTPNLDPTNPQPLEPTPFRPPPASPIR